MNNNFVSNKRVLISGGTLGIGFNIAKILLENGARVIIFSRKPVNLSQAMAKLQTLGELYGVNADVSSNEDTKQIFKLVDEKFSGLDILINNAGLPGGTIEETDLDEIEYINETNLIGFLRLAKLAIERMKNGGHIVNISSMSAETLDAGSSVYAAAKSGINGFNECLRKEVFDKNIKVTLIEPGAVATKLHGLPLEQVINEAKNNLMLFPQDVAEAVFFSLNQPERVDIIKMALKPRKQNI